MEIWEPGPTVGLWMSSAMAAALTDRLREVTVIDS